MLLCLFIGGSDCVPQVGIGEAADCCACLANRAVDGAEPPSGSNNCLPDDRLQGLSEEVERDQCAAAAADAISGIGEVVVVVACLDPPHPCATICAAAKDGGVVFAP